MTRSMVPWRETFPRYPSVINTRLFDRMWDDMFSAFGSLESASDEIFGTNVVPFDVRNVKDEKGNVTGTELVYTVAGYKPEDVNVEVDDYNNMLTISAEKSEETTDNKYEYVRKGLARRSFSVSYHLDGIDKEKIDAKVKDGILTVSLPLSQKVLDEKKGPRKINLLKA